MASHFRANALSAETYCKFLGNIHQQCLNSHHTHLSYLRNYAKVQHNSSLPQMHNTWRAKQLPIVHPIQEHFISRDFNQPKSIKLDHLENGSFGEVFVDELKKMNESMKIFQLLYKKVIGFREDHYDVLRHDSGEERLRQINDYFPNAAHEITSTLLAIDDTIRDIEYASKMKMMVDSKSPNMAMPSNFTRIDEYLMGQELQMIYLYSCEMLETMKSKCHKKN